MTGILTLIISGLLAFLIIRSIYRLYFHPLSKFPGPKLAAVSSAYEFYFNVIKRGKFVWELERLHDVYGPIIRITPREIHIKDSSYYDEIYASNLRRREKDALVVKKFDLDGSGFSAISPELHRQRRAPLERFFSKAAVAKIENSIRSHLDKFCDHLRRAYASHNVVPLDAGFSALTSDIIHQYSFGFNSGNLDQENFNEHVRDGINALFTQSHIAFFFPIIPMIINALPLPLLEKLNPYAFALVSQKKDLHRRSAEALEGKTNNGSIIEFIAGAHMPQHMRTPNRLADEGLALIIGGTETTARSLGLGMYHLLRNENIIAKLREELRSVMPTPESRPTWNQLEQLPYLSAVISEILRVSTGIASRSPRVAPSETLIYKNYLIPPGTPVSETNYFVLMDPAIFPNPHVFDPERWLRAAAKGERLDRYLVNFSKGSRICVGMNLVYAELYLILSTLVRRFDLELHETTEKNIGFARDFGTPYPEEGNFSVRVIVTRVIQEPIIEERRHTKSAYLRKLVFSCEAHLFDFDGLTLLRAVDLSFGSLLFIMPTDQHVSAALSLIENDKTKILGLNVGPHRNVQPGDYIPRADAQTPPEFFFPGLDTSKTYLIVGLDIDAPFPSFGVLGPILHWIQPGVKITESSTLDTSAPFIANYIGPAPPPGSSPHRYIFFLYEEPAGFEPKKYPRGWQDPEQLVPHALRS
ncbi:uncharacterized protein N7477_007519 [Penicillium maclennaniae]|uniref:uncharacterized protein n=1 Tax=Penicillium maclennaniae TaxID=1343394 RepID=UPI0025425C2B|nr:uncharacterized protein N7477_007519 [Penicillium maclennaniae]KAJ5665071.1 hypothetical protein N7477_007519 [Penicillium maclennaniae]